MAAYLPRAGRKLEETLLTYKPLRAGVWLAFFWSIPVAGFSIPAVMDNMELAQFGFLSWPLAFLALAGIESSREKKYVSQVKQYLGMGKSDSLKLEGYQLFEKRGGVPTPITCYSEAITGEIYRVGENELVKFNFVRHPERLWDRALQSVERSYSLT